MIKHNMFFRLVLLTAILSLGWQTAFANSKEKRIVIESEGWKLVGDLLIPKAKKFVPAVILLNKANGDRKVYTRLAKYLAAQGIASLRIDLRAHGESINKGKFIPFQENSPDILNDNDKDIIAITQYLKAAKGIDANRIGFVGASYSAEEMTLSARKTGYGKAYIALSPGSFSDESINSIDESRASWLFIKSANERARTLKDLFPRLREKSKLAQTMEVSGDKHATDILDSSPELSEILAIWFKYHLQGAAKVDPLRE